jgi:hypothetical protein
MLFALKIYHNVYARVTPKHDPIATMATIATRCYSQMWSQICGYTNFDCDHFWELIATALIVRIGCLNLSMMSCLGGESTCNVYYSDIAITLRCCCDWCQPDESTLLLYFCIYRGLLQIWRLVHGYTWATRCCCRASIYTSATFTTIAVFFTSHNDWQITNGTNRMCA